MKTLSFTVVSVVAALLIAPSALAQDDRALLRQADQARGDQSATVDDQERQAREQLAASQVRLELVLARKAVRAGALQVAADRAWRVQTLLSKLPASIDATEWELQVEAILARASRAGVKAPHAVVRGTAAQASRPRRSPIEVGYRPSAHTLDIDAILRRDGERLAAQGTLRQRYKSDEVRRLVEADQTRVAPEGVVAYPANWPAKIDRRAANAGGQIARSSSWTDAEGREWYAAIYDISDLTYEVPDFRPPFSLHPAEALRNAEDRAALRRYSQIFNGYAEDLAAGIPLLRFFGGVDDFEFRGPKYSEVKEQQIVRMINAFTQRQTEAQVVPVGP